MESAHDALRHRRLTRLFTKARALPAREREAWVVEACGGDGALEEELRALLAADAGGGVLEDVAAGEVHRKRLERQLDRLVTEPGDDAGQVPERIGPFCPKEVIGRGGMAVVYLAQQDKPRRDVALKVLRGDVSAEAAARIEREADLLARLEHPCIARIYSAGRAQTPWGEQGYIAMELVNGRPLLRFAREESLGLRARVELMVRIAQALESAHGRGIVHRDLKPSNILVQRDGTPKLLDFGVARLRSLDLGDTAHTRTGQIVGTLATMAPEQAAGRSDVDERADVYALGVLLYELCADRLPIDTRGLPLHEALRRIQEDDPVPLGALRPNLRGDIETIVLKALEKEPRRRYRDAGEFALDLARYLADEPILARTQRWRDHMRRFARRHRALVVGVGVAFLGLIATLVVSLFLLGRAKAENRRAIRGREAALRLTDLRRLGQLQRTAAVLWPAQEERLEEFEAWIAEATLMVGKLDWHRSLLEVFRERFGSPVGRKRLAMEDSVNAKINGELWMYEAQEELVRRLAHFAARGGLFERLKERRNFAASLKRRTVDDLALDWERAAEWVRDPAGPYALDSGGLTLIPRSGLIPLGRDARTGFLALVLDIFGLAPTDWDPEHSSEPDWGACVVLLLPSGGGESNPVYLAAWPVGNSLWRDFEGSPGAHQQPQDDGKPDAMDRTRETPGPQTLVSFDEAVEFAQHLGGRLPTARELERALSLGIQPAGPELAEWVVREGEPWVAGPGEALGSAAQAPMRSPEVTFRIVLDPGL